MFIEQISAEAYAYGCSEILGEPVSLDEVFEDPDTLNYRVMEMMNMLECGVTTRTRH